MKKKLLLTILFGVFLSFILLANGNVERNVWLLPRSCVNSESKMFDLTQSLSCEVIPSGAYTDESSYSAQIARVRSTLLTGSTVTIDPGPNGWYFVHENNKTKKRPFSIKCYRYNWTIDSNTQNTYNEDSYLDNNLFTPSSYDDITPYSFTLPACSETQYNLGLIENQVPNFFEEELVLELPSVSDVDNLETGYYYAEFTITYVDINGSTIIQPIKIKGYVNISASEISEPFSFYVASTDKTYNLDLTDTDTYNSIVTLNFNKTKPENLASAPTGTGYDDKYTIYISPASEPTSIIGVYSLVGAISPYVFIRKGTENQLRTQENTVVYRIYKNTSGGTFDSLNNNGVTFKIPVPYTYDEVSQGTIWGNSNKDYIEKWVMDNTPIYIKPEDLPENTIQQAGSYYSNIYFFVYSKD